MFLVPTEENFSKIANITKKGYMNNLVVIFVGNFEDPEESLKTLVQMCASRCSSIKKVMVFELNFIALNRNLFSLAAGLG